MIVPHTPVIIALLVLSSVVGGLSACTKSRGFDRASLHASLQLDSEDLARHDRVPVFEGPSPLPSPFRLALYIVTRTRPVHAALLKPDWLGADKDRLIRSLQPVVDEGIVSDVFLLADSTVQSTRVHDIRMAAGRYQADTVLIVDSVAAMDRYNNLRALWYATGLGAYLASGTQTDALFLIQGTIWDTRTGVRLGTQSSEGTAQAAGPAVSLDDKQVLARAQQAAIESFGRETAAFLRLMKHPTPSAQ